MKQIQKSFIIIGAVLCALLIGNNVFALTVARSLGFCLCHPGYPIKTFFLPAIAFAGPLRVRALV